MHQHLDFEFADTLSPQSSGNNSLQGQIPASCSSYPCPCSPCDASLQLPGSREVAHSFLSCVIPFPSCPCLSFFPRRGGRIQPFLLQRLAFVDPPGRPFDNGTLQFQHVGTSSRCCVLCILCILSLIFHPHHLNSWLSSNVLKHFSRSSGIIRVVTRVTPSSPPSEKISRSVLLIPLHRSPSQGMSSMAPRFANSQIDSGMITSW